MLSNRVEKVRIVIVGGSSVDKTKLIQSFLNVAIDNLNIIPQVYERTITVSNRSIKLEIWDIPEQQPDNYFFPNPNIVIYVFDPTDPESLSALKTDWQPKAVKNHRSDVTLVQVLIANYAADTTFITHDREIENWIREERMLFYRTQTFSPQSSQALINRGFTPLSDILTVATHKYLTSLDTEEISLDDGSAPNYCCFLPFGLNPYRFLPRENNSQEIAIRKSRAKVEFAKMRRGLGSDVVGLALKPDYGKWRIPGTDIRFGWSRNVSNTPAVFFYFNSKYARASFVEQLKEKGIVANYVEQMDTMDTEEKCVVVANANYGGLNIATHFKVAEALALLVESFKFFTATYSDISLISLISWQEGEPVKFLNDSPALQQNPH
jgi:hypothetical protein